MCSTEPTNSYHTIVFSDMLRGTLKAKAGKPRLKAMNPLPSIGWTAD